MNPEENKPNIHKKVDEAWKDQAEKEKGTLLKAAQQPAPGKAAKEGAPQGDFNFFLSSLSMQALMALGELPNPVTNERQEDLEQARYLIDVIGMLQDKTKGNLSPEESQMLESALYELRMKYVARTGGGTPRGPVR